MARHLPTLDEWASTLNLKQRGVERIGPCPLCGGQDRFHVVERSLGVNLPFSPRGEVKCVRGPSGRGARRLARAGELEQYDEHGKQAQRSPGGRIVCFDRRVVRNAGWLWRHG